MIASIHVHFPKDASSVSRVACRWGRGAAELRHLHFRHAPPPLRGGRSAAQEGRAGELAGELPERGLGGVGVCVRARSMVMLMVMG